jgi:hypothetical protein
MVRCHPFMASSATFDKFSGTRSGHFPVYCKEAPSVGTLPEPEVFGCSTRS